jgi:hypothetical protein
MLGGFDVPGNYFTAQGVHWVTLLVPAYFDGRSEVEMVRSSQHLRLVLKWPDHIIRSRYWLTYAAFASPEFWAVDGAQDDEESMMRGMRFADIRFPSAKGLLLDVGAGALVSEPGPEVAYVGKADGSAGPIPWVGYDPDTVACKTQFFGSCWQVLATRFGVWGVDVR